MFQGMYKIFNDSMRKHHKLKKNNLPATIKSVYCYITRYRLKVDIKIQYLKVPKVGKFMHKQAIMTKPHICRNRILTENTFAMMRETF